ncbi:hypothetical protein [Amycolatopsis benzoatilytica]|uniref:hypothetical protein n=1 Tax=Amycolatopsis benzoatilytica TaxID=346045 RepID=UPI0003621ED6|nr:hypothetical protein [Amycolatopsis benzoatilytica]
MGAHWTPRDDAELTAGWQLWLALDSCARPSPDWDGTPAEAVRGIERCCAACDEILAGYDEPDSAVAGLVRSMFLATSWTMKLWRDDSDPLDAERAALLHADLAAFTEHAESVRTLLATGGGWASLPR